MKKVLFLMALLMSFASVDAQNHNYAGSSSFWDNISIGIDGGISTNLHDWNTPQGANVGITLNKEISPIFGVSAEVGVGFNDNANHLCHKMIDGTRHNILSHGGVGVDNLTAIADGRINLMNALAKYKGRPRVFEIEAVVGIGYGRTFEANEKHLNSLLFASGANLNFFLNKSRSLKLGLNPRVIWDVNHHNSNKLDSKKAIGRLNMTLTYAFKNSNGKHYIGKYVCPPSEPIIKKEVVTKVETTIVTNIIPIGGYTVSFAQGSAELSNTEKAILNSIDVNIGSFVIEGFASPEGNADLNMELSQRRANVVAEYLKNRGAKILSVSGKGANAETANRIVKIFVNANK